MPVHDVGPAEAQQIKGDETVDGFYPPDPLPVFGLLLLKVVGYVDLHDADPRDKELGFLVGPSHRWVHGLGRRLAEAGLAYGLGELSLDRIWAEAPEANTASVSILRSLGMSETGRGAPGQFLQIDSYQLQFRISRQEWLQGPK